jgi:hypothetical protein
MKRERDPIGDDNFKHIGDVANEAGIIIAAWGTNARFLTEVPRQVRLLLRDHNRQLYHLGVNADGSPKHPLYLKADTKPVLWTTNLENSATPSTAAKSPAQ